MDEKTRFVAQNENADILDILGEMRDADGLHGDGAFVCEGINDGKVMDCEVPKNVHVVLKKPEIDSAGVDVSELAKLTAADEFADALDRGVVDVGVVDAEHQLARGGECD